MGRYDKLRVYNGSAWVQPRRVRVFSNNAWQDLGENDSDNTRTGYTRYNNDWHRFTLNKTYVTVPGESYLGGNGFRLLPANGYCYCPNGSLYVQSVDTTWIFRAWIRKSASGDQRIFWTGNSSNSCMLKILWLADGRVRVTCVSAPFSSNPTQSITTTNAVGEGQWVYLDVICNRGVRVMSVTFNGVTTSGDMWKSWQIVNADNWVGSAGVQFKDYLEVQGTQYEDGSTSKILNPSNMSGNTNDYQGATHIDTSYQEVQWT